ncbi:amidohydrolase family protein [Oceanirhabdus sp. W0125-5]|uniref:amidohydrolase family protein n=1 Tax=Oceanirhabdus sp. W0125-5 TaxID=2999116 RepID=UPI0022F32189|nr:TatD family hydrolase [Oceanirhabdus sp. W0125-5]WBW99235.1 TatD family hydrolase [Oceanirhabdus sp. W0125-5]
MKIIDAHMHFSNIESFKRTAEELSFIDYSSKGILKEYDENGVVYGIGMGLTEGEEGGFPDVNSINPMCLDLEKNPDNVLTCIGINPVVLDTENEEIKEQELKRIEEALKEKNVVGIKIYAGYYHYHVWDEVYTPVYKLAEKYKLPVVIHSGDTYSERGLLKYSKPLEVDELALKFRWVNFIIAHFGDPWVMETAEIISKNSNVYADISGLIVGNEAKVQKFMNEKLFMEHFKRAFVYADNYKKILFGTDWPLVRVKPYIEFVKELIPEEHWEDVFYNNAAKLFNI